MTMKDRAPNIEDVARHAGVSRAAVSKVLRNAYGVSDEMRVTVEKAVAELNYRPRVAAQAMRGATYTIGMLLPSLESPFFSQIYEGVQNELAGTRYRTVVTTASGENQDEAAALDNLLDRQVDGVIVLSPIVDQQHLERVAQHVPMVVIARHDQSESYDTVVGDDIAGARLVMEHLIDAGHERILHLTHRSGEHLTDAQTPHALRRQAYEAVMAERGLSAYVQILDSGFDEEPARLATLEALRGGERPTAIFAGADIAAFGALSALEELDIADRIAVCGYDNTRFAAHPRISLTSVDQHGVELGRSSASLLLSRIDGRSTADHVVTDPRLIVRNSSVLAPQTSSIGDRL